jgi:DNA-binding transcriptional LysR family regulator
MNQGLTPKETGALMRFNKLDLNLLVALDAMLKEGSISRAAEKLHVSQPAMSSALSRLREYFNDELLVQVGRKMELTPRAQVLQEAVRDVLVRVDTTIAAQPEFDAASSEREFRLFVSDYTLDVLMPHVLALADAQAPSVRFQLLPQVDQPQRSLERGEADLLVIPKGYCSPEHPHEMLFNEEFCCMVWDRSRWIGKTLSFEDYVGAGHVVMQPSGGGQPAFEGWFMQRYGISRRIEITTYSFTSAPRLVVGTQRIATVHKRLARQAQRSLPLRSLALPVPVPLMEQSMQWHKYRTQDPGLMWLRGLLHQAVQLMDAQAPQPSLTGQGG